MLPLFQFTTTLKNQKSQKPSVRMISRLSLAALTDVVVPSVALVPAAKGKPDIEDDIIKWVAERVPDHQTLRGGVHISEVIPRGHTGKVLRTALRGKYPLNESKWSWV